MKPITLPGIDEYAEQHTTADPTQLTELTAETYANLTDPQMMSGPVQGRFLQMLVHALRPRLIVEIGTFSGYASLSMAAALPPGGHIVTCEINPVHAQLARKHIAASDHSGKITVEVGPALQTIGRLSGPFDLVFIDADKAGYPRYFEAALAKLAPHGLIACDNTLWNGDVLNADSIDPDTRALRAFNTAVAADPRVSTVLVTIRDGLTLIRKV